MLCSNVESKFVLALEQHTALGTTVCAVDEVRPVFCQPGKMRKFWQCIWELGTFSEEVLLHALNSGNAGHKLS